MSNFVDSNEGREKYIAELKENYLKAYFKKLSILGTPFRKLSMSSKIINQA
jgi:hypothetical protein